MFHLYFHYDTGAFDGTQAQADAEVERILVTVAEQVRAGEVAGLVRDRDSTRIGRWSRYGGATPTDERCPNCGAPPEGTTTAYEGGCPACGYGRPVTPALPHVVDAALALMTVERLRVEADSLRAGDRVLTVRSGVIMATTVAATTELAVPLTGPVVVIATEDGGQWTGVASDRSWLRVAA